MKRLYILLSILLLSVAAVEAQPKIEFDALTKDVGYVLWRVPVTVTYNFTNTGDKPLVLSNVSTSCGCMTADWTKSPVEPGASGIIKVTFDAETIGHFFKDVSIYCNAEYKPIYLDFNGEVTADSEDYMFTHPFDFNAIRLNKKDIKFGQVNKGTKPQVEILIANSSNKIYRPMLMHLPPYLTCEAEPVMLNRGDAGKLKITLDTDKLLKYGVNTTYVYLSRYLGDNVCDENRLEVSALLLPDFDKMSDYEKKNPAHIETSAKTVDFPLLKKNQKKTQILEVKNTGRSNLVIKDIQLSGISVAVNLSDDVIKPGMVAKMKVTMMAKNLNREKDTPSIMLITNDPDQPVVVVPVTGQIVK